MSGFYQRNLHQVVKWKKSLKSFPFSFLVFQFQRLRNHSGPGAMRPCCVPFTQVKQIPAHYLIGPKTCLKMSDFNLMDNSELNISGQNRYDYIIWLRECCVTNKTCAGCSVRGGAVWSRPRIHNVQQVTNHSYIKHIFNNLFSRGLIWKSCWIQMIWRCLDPFPLCPPDLLIKHDSFNHLIGVNKCTAGKRSNHPNPQSEEFCISSSGTEELLLLLHLLLLF